MFYLLGSTEEKGHKQKTPLFWQLLSDSDAKFRHLDLILSLQSFRCTDFFPPLDSFNQGLFLHQGGQMKVINFSELSVRK